MLNVTVSLILLLLVATSSVAAEIDFTQDLYGIDGSRLQQQVVKDGPLEPLTLGDVAVVALVSPSDDERNLDPMKKFQRDRLARKIYKNSKAELSPEEVSLIKERIGKIYGPVQIGASWPLLDPTLK